MGTQKNARLTESFLDADEFGPVLGRAARTLALLLNGVRPPTWEARQMNVGGRAAVIRPGNYTGSRAGPAFCVRADRRRSEQGQTAKKFSRHRVSQWSMPRQARPVPKHQKVEPSRWVTVMLIPCSA
jgi:hypothetical protein